MLQKTCHRVGFLEVDTAMDMERFFFFIRNEQEAGLVTGKICIAVQVQGIISQPEREL